uniref:Protein TonB n=1 Tax=Candidatus Kentrum sp. FW TaxID=2126338 RepID=A0A450SF69_9GAMM|nr:MAG: protein TonB [Candidatus Kentron sp. FW]
MKRYHWSTGMLFSGVVHVLFFAYLLSSEAEPVSGGTLGGEGGIVVALAYSSGESGHGIEKPEKTEPAEILPLEKEEKIETQPVKRKKPRKIREKTPKKQKLRKKHTKPTQHTSARADSSEPAQGASALGSSGSLQGIGDYRQGTRDYQAVLQAWLEKHKRYPKRAMRRRIEGKGILYFQLDRNGNVLARGLRAKTGSGILDREILATLKRASPLPPVPEGISGSALEFTIPIEFSIR